MHPAITIDRHLSLVINHLGPVTECAGQRRRHSLVPRSSTGRASVGNPRINCVADEPSSTPADRSRQSRANTRKCGHQPAHQSLLNRRLAALPPALRHRSIVDCPDRCRERIVAFEDFDNEHQNLTLRLHTQKTVTNIMEPTPLPRAAKMFAFMDAAATGAHVGSPTRWWRLPKVDEVDLRPPMRMWEPQHRLSFQNSFGREPYKPCAQERSKGTYWV
jgi:hypothetical protein